MVSLSHHYGVFFRNSALAGRIPFENLSRNSFPSPLLDKRFIFLVPFTDRDWQPSDGNLFPLPDHWRIPLSLLQPLSGPSSSFVDNSFFRCFRHDLGKVPSAGQGFACRSNRISVCSSRLAPLATSRGRVYSCGEWLMPPTLGTKIRAEGAMRAIFWASWAAPLGSRA